MTRSPHPLRPTPTARRFRPRLETLDDRITPALAFDPAQSFAVGATPRSLAVADFNGDGRPDLATAAASAGAVSVLVNSTPLGGSAAFYTANYFTATGPQAVTVGDFNGDGRPDLATVNSGGTASVLLNTTPPGTATPTFATQQPFAVGTNPGALAATDFNGDGRTDLVVIGSGGVDVLLNTTAGGAAAAAFAPKQTIYSQTDRGSLAVGDFNGDGRPDLAFTSTFAGGISYISYTTYLRVLTNTTAAGSGTLAGTTDSTTLYFSTTSPGGAFFVSAGDLDGDGRSDLTYANRTTVGVLANRTPAGAARTTFDPVRTFAAGTVNGPPVVGDFDGDGRADIGVPNVGNTAAVLVNTTPTFDPTPTFAGPQLFAVGSNPTALAAGEFNGDGRLDLAAVHSGTAAATLLSNASAEQAVSGPPVVGQFGTTGVWALDRVTGWWRQLTASNADALAAAPNGNVVASFGDHGVWYYQPTHGWYLINSHRAKAVGIDGLGNVVASFEGFGTAAYRLADGWSAPLTAVAADRLAVNANGQLAAHFPNHGLYTYSAAAGWRFLHGYPITALALGENGDVAVSFVGYGVNVWRPTTDWVRLNDADATSLAMNANGSVVAGFAGGGVGKYIPATNTWQTLHSGTPAVSVAMDLYGNVFATLGGYGVYEFNPLTGWRLRTTSAAGLLDLG